jgi:flavodoxin
MKNAIIFESKHHGNTKKICDAISEKCGVDLYDAATFQGEFPWDKYDVVGFASGIAFSRFYEHVNEVAKHIPAGKKVFYIYTCAKNDKDFAANIKQIVEERGGKSLGTYGCRGYNTFGPLKLVGGMNKANPTVDEIEAAIEFYKKVVTDGENKD